MSESMRAQTRGAHTHPHGERVAILGASDKPTRYSHRALRMLIEHGHSVVPVNPALADIDGHAVVASLDAIEGAVDTLTVYLRPAMSSPLAAHIRELAPRRVILNPGAENPDLVEALSGSGIEIQLACTLVLLRTGAF